MKQENKKLIIMILSMVFFCQHIAFVLADATEYHAAEDEWDVEGEDEKSNETEITDYEQLGQDDIEGSFSSAPVTFMEEEYYAVTVPKNIVMDKDGIADFQIQIKGNISPAYCIQAEAVDMEGDREGINFYLTDAGVKLTADVLQEKTVWDYEDVKNGAAGAGRIIMENVYPGEWEGELFFQIKKRKINSGHKHIYQKRAAVQPTCEEEGLMLYICGCGGSYTENIGTVEHEYADGYCIMCGEEWEDENDTWGDDDADDIWEDEEWEDDETEGNGMLHEEYMDDDMEIEVYSKIYY